MHPLLARQVRKAGLGTLLERPEVSAFLERVSDAYGAADEDRRLLEHSLNLASDELFQRNRSLEAELAQRIELRQKLDASALEVEANERRYHALFELSPVGIVAFTLPDGHVLQSNDMLLRLASLSREQLQEQGCPELAQAVMAELGDDALPAAEVAGAAPGAGRIQQFGPCERQVSAGAGRLHVMISGICVHQADGRSMAWVILQDISERKATEHRLAEAARSDRLTGLANRASFMERLERAIARIAEGQQQRYAVMFLDFDRFKLVNDTLGHQAGDELLVAIAGRLRSELRASDALAPDSLGNVISRFGGDEFLVLINDLRSDNDALRIADRLLAALTPAYTIRGSEVHSTASIGLVTSGSPVIDAEEVVRNADLAMYEAKRAGRARVVRFNESMHERVTRHVMIENSLRRALADGQLRLVYQPIIELATQRLVSVEALMRWHHPDLGEVPPSEFIPIAEESRLILQLGLWLQRTACEQLRRWQQADPEGAPPTVSINVSQAEMAHGLQFVEQVDTVLRETGLPPHCLQLEVTEREVSRDLKGSLVLLNALHTLGVKLAMDDFGTGTSALGFLRGYPFDTVKIDRSFLHDLVNSADGLAVLHAAVNLVENLGMASVAEGVESASQLAVLQSLGCRYAQGFFLGRPQPPGESAPHA